MGLWKINNDTARVRPQEVKERPTSQEAADACKVAYCAAHASLRKGKGKGLGKGKKSGEMIPTSAVTSLESVSVSAPASTQEPQASQPALEEPRQEFLRFGLVGHTPEQIFAAISILSC